jgi:hypothetical protein
MRKASSEDELQGLAQRYSQTAKGQWARTDEQAAGIWMGAAFENQNKHLEFKRTDWRTGQLSDGGRRAFVDEIYENRGSYNLAQMNSNTIEQLKGTHDHYEAIVANRASTNQQRDEALDQMGKIRSVSETFMHELGGGAGGPQPVGPNNTPISVGPSGAGGSRQSSTPGAAYVAERVRELQDVSHNYKAGPSGFYDPGHAPTANRKEHR